MGESIEWGVVKTSKGWYQPAYQNDEGNYTLLGTEEFKEENDAWIYLREKIAPYLCIVKVEDNMLLTFTKPQFKDLIKQGIKRHTIREDKHNRWKVGNSIQFWMGNPRNVHAKNKPHQFGNGICSRVETIRMDFSIPEDWQNDRVYIGNDIVLKTDDELNALAVNDGFENWSQMKFWFDNEDKMFVGKIIFWKNCTWL